MVEKGIIYIPTIQLVYILTSELNWRSIECSHVVFSLDNPPVIKLERDDSISNVEMEGLHAVRTIVENSETQVMMFGVNPLRPTAIRKLLVRDRSRL